MNVPDNLRATAKIYEQRNKVYGNNYKQFGHAMLGMFPDGVVLKTAEDFNRFGIFVQVVSKVTRYANTFKSGGHPDSLDDISVYAQMLNELDHEAMEENTK